MKYKIFLAIFILSLISSVILTMNSTALCDPNDGCDTVNSSSYGSTFGIKNSIYGIFIFTGITLLTISHIRNPHPHKRTVLHAGIILGSLIAIYFLFLQVFIIKAFCKFCLVVDIGLLVALGFLIYLWEH